MAKTGSKVETEIGKTIYVCNVQHQNPDGEWVTHAGVTKRTKDGVADYIKQENTDIGGGLVEWSKNPRRLLVRAVTIDSVEYQKLR